MFKTFLVVGLAFLAAGCVPNQLAPPEAGAEQEVSEDLIQRLESCEPNFSVLKVGNSAYDLPSNNVPDYIDILSVESSLDGEILTVVIYLKSIPQELAIDRESHSELAKDTGKEEIPFVYYWNVNIDVDGAARSPKDLSLFDYMFSSGVSLGSLSSEELPTAIDFEDAVSFDFFEFEHQVDRQQLSHLHHAGPAQLNVSYKDNSLTFRSKVPGITDSSTLFFYSGDDLLRHDGISCET